MEFTCSTDLVSQLSVKDLKALAPAIARQLLDSAEPIQIARLVLSRDEALRLLTEKICKHPKETLAALSSAASNNGASRQSAARRPVGLKAKRPRADSAKLKEEVLAFLKSHPASGRKGICAMIKFPSANVYTRVMSQLVADKKVSAAGDKRGRVYTLR